MKLRVHFEDEQQDLLWIDIDDKNAIAQCNGAVSSIYREWLLGRTVRNPNSMRVGGRVKVDNRHGEAGPLRYVIQAIEKHPLRIRK